MQDLINEELIVPNMASKRGSVTHQYVINLSLTREQLESFYAGHVNQVWARDVRGVAIQFPLQALRPYVTHSGVKGRFKLKVTADHRLKSLESI